MGRDEVHQAEGNALHARVCRDVEGAVHGGGRLDEHMQRQFAAAQSAQMPLGQQHVVHAFHLGQHEVAQAVAGLADDDVQVLREAGVVHGMHARSHAGAGRGITRQRGHQARMGGLLAHGAPSSQSSVTSNTQVPNSAIISACSCRLLRMRTSTPL